MFAKWYVWGIIDATSFWLWLKSIVPNFLCMYRSTYLCGSTFSSLARLKNKFRSSLSQQNVESEIRCEISKSKPNCKWKGVCSIFNDTEITKYEWGFVNLNSLLQETKKFTFIKMERFRNSVINEQMIRKILQINQPNTQTSKLESSSSSMYGNCDCGNPLSSNLFFFRIRKKE